MVQVLFDLSKVMENHTSGHNKNGEFEGLYAHSALVRDVFKAFIEKRKIKFHFESLSVEKTKELVKYMEEIVFLHDIGKLNPFAQKYYQGFLQKSSKTEHSKLSLLLIFLIYYNKFLILMDKSLSLKNRTEQHIFNLYLLLLSHCVTFHHTNLSKYSVVTQKNGIPLISVEETFQNILSDKKEILAEVISSGFPEWDVQEKINMIEDFFNKDILTTKEKKNLFFNIKLFYSLLVLSDYYATYLYKSGKKLDDLKINQIDHSLLEMLESNFHSVDYNQEIKSSNRENIRPLNECESVNDLRNNLLIEAVTSLQESLRNDPESKIFTLNVPTGGGKTNISMKLALEILKKKGPKISRINWVFPYVNIIEQNYLVIKNTLFKNDGKLIKNNLSQIYYDSFDLTEEELIDYDNNKNELFEKYLNLSFINNPINVISNVNFFNAFFKVKKNNRYKFANFVNSIVILDEIQSLNSDYINLFYKLLADIAKRYNIYFIVMSATLPNPSDYTGESVSVELIKNYSEYFNHRIFKRNKIIYEKSSITDINSLFSYCKDKILLDHKEQDKFLIVVNTVKTSIKLFNMFRDNITKSEFKIFLLNSLISKVDRNEIIEYIKKSKGEKIILVSTQSIEAGVDLDFDIGFRDYAILDSMEQVCGRINRECSSKKSSQSKVYLFNFKNEAKIYEKDLRFKISKSLGDNLVRVLENRSFVDYYRKYFEEIKMDIESARRFDYSHEIASLNYKRIHELNIIPAQNGLKLISDDIGVEERKKFHSFLDKHRCKTIRDLINLRNKGFSIEDQPVIKFINTLINKNSIEINLYREEDKIHFKKFLKSKNYLLEEINENTFIIATSFYEEYIVEYMVNNLNFSYLDIDKLLKENFFEFRKEKDQAMFI